ncbi:MAG: radical SAM protein [Nitrospirae bacterium]|nr:radical SAM protein [Nitrospirota bacterium]
MNLKQFNPLKILNHWEVLNEIMKGHNPAPISCEIDPSNICNHNCIWCINDKYRHDYMQMLPEDMLMRIIDEVAAMGIKSIAYTGGGEPLTNPATVKALYKTTEYGLDAALVTNGGLLNEENIEAIVKNCMYVRISVDAGSNNVHKQLHLPNNQRDDEFQQIIKSIEWLVQVRRKLGAAIEIGVGFLVFPANYQQVFDTASLMKDIGIDYIQIRPAYMQGVKLSEKIWHETKEQMERALTLSNGSFKVFPILHRFDEVENLERGYSKCLGHALVGVVGANGKMYLCCQLRGYEKYCFGDLHESSFKEIWNSNRRKKVIEGIQLSECPPCRYNKYNEILDYLTDNERPHKNFL